MEQCSTITNHVELVKALQQNSNENTIKTFEILTSIEKLETWKKQWYYEGQETYSFEKLSVMDFSSFVYHVFKKTEQWYKSVEAIISLKDGKELLLKFGRENMVTYYHSTDKERSAILSEANEGRRIPKFNEIKRTLYPTERTKVINLWKEECERLRKKVKELKAEVKKVKKEFTEYRKKVELMMEKMNEIRKAS